MPADVPDRPCELPVAPGYRILRPIAAGGMGNVYEAEKLSTHERFAVKFIREHLVDEPKYVARFEREVSALRAIRHPNVVELFEWRIPGPGSGVAPFIVMELLRGEALEDRLRRETRIPWPEAVQIMLQVLDGLAAAHARGVIHRDLGPSNIYLAAEPDGRPHVKLLDFGLARPLGAQDVGPAVTQEGTWMGKPAYVAPELLCGAQLDERADLFACGMMLFRTLTGRLPYRESNAQLLWMERYAERLSPPEYPAPRTLEASVPESLDRIVALAVRKRPEQRYATARAMQADLLRFEHAASDEVATTVIEAPPVPAGPSGSSVIDGRSTSAASGRSPSRVRASVVAAVLVGLALLATAVLYLRRGPAGREAGGTGNAAGPSVASAAPGEAPGADASAAGAPGEASPAADAEAAAPVDGAGGAPADVPSRAASDAGRKAVRLTFENVPRGAEVRVGGVPVPGGKVAEVPWSEEGVRVTVTAGAGWEPFATTVVPSEDRVVAVRMRRTRERPPDGAAAGPRDAGRPPDAATGRPGPFGTVFSTQYDEPRP